MDSTKKEISIVETTKQIQFTDTKWIEDELIINDFESKGIKNYKLIEDKGNVRIYEVSEEDFNKVFKEQWENINT